jgi:hypothetical protein
VKEIIRSSEPSSKQLLDMAANLKEKFKAPACVEMAAWTYNLSEPKIKYLIFVDNTLSIHRMEMTWDQCQDYYFELMRG